MTSRLCSHFSSLAVPFLLLAVSIGLVGCYPHQGKPVDAAPEQLLALAHDACRRHDPEAWNMLLMRLADRHPETRQAARARQLLDEQDGALSTCQGTLPAAEAGD